jgi:hypothetical protein
LQFLILLLFPIGILQEKVEDEEMQPRTGGLRPSGDGDRVPFTLTFGAIVWEGITTRGDAS